MDYKLFYDLDKQVIAMIRDAIGYLQTNKIDIEDKVIMDGYSSAGAFAERFTMLHPELIKMIISGGAMDMLMLPLNSYQGKSLDYPLGIADYKEITGREFDFKAYKSIPKLYYLGKDDDCDNIFYKDCWYEKQTDLILSFLPRNMYLRATKHIEQYSKQDFEALYIFDVGIGHSVSKQMNDYIEEFIKANVDSDTPVYPEVISPNLEPTLCGDVHFEDVDAALANFKLKNPEQIIQFVDPVFEQMVRDLYKLGEGEIKWKDIGYRRELVLDRGFDLKGEIKTLEDLKWFLNLEVIKMPERKISGDIKVLADLKGLNEIKLKETSVTGDLSSLSGLTHLESLSLYETNVVGDLNSLADLKELATIYLFELPVTGDLSDLKEIKGLRSIGLDNTQVQGDLSDLISMKKLHSIYLSCPKVTGKLSDLSNFKDLDTISLGHTRVEGDLSDLSSFKKLTRIYLSHNPEITGNLSALSRLTDLEKIRLNDTQVQGDLSSLSNLSKLEVLKIKNTKVTGKLVLPNGDVIKAD